MRESAWIVYLNQIDPNGFLPAVSLVAIMVAIVVAIFGLFWLAVWAVRKFWRGPNEGGWYGP